MRRWLRISVFVILAVSLRCVATGALIIQGNHYYHLPKFASPECAFYGERARGGGSKGVILELIPPFNQAAAQWQHGRAGGLRWLPQFLKFCPYTRRWVFAPLYMKMMMRCVFFRPCRRALLCFSLTALSLLVYIYTLQSISSPAAFSLLFSS